MSKEEIFSLVFKLEACDTSRGIDAATFYEWFSHMSEILFNDHNVLIEPWLVLKADSTNTDHVELVVDNVDEIRQGKQLIICVNDELINSRLTHFVNMTSSYRRQTKKH